MAITVDEDEEVQSVSSVLDIVTGTIAFDSSYPTGGEDAAPISNHMKQCVAILVEGESGYTFSYDRDNDKLLVYTGGSEVGNGVDLSSLTDVTFVAIGVN